jgi:hypothetical protein
MHKGKGIVLIKKPIRDKLTWYFYYYHTDDGVHFNRSNRHSCGLEADDIGAGFPLFLFIP